MKSKEINIITKKGGHVWIIMSTLTLSVFYFRWLYYNITDAANRDITQSKEYLLLIPIYLIFYGFSIFFLKKILVKEIGNVSIHIGDDNINISYKLYGFLSKKKYALDQIEKIRIVEKGNMIYQVAFNYGPNENFIGVGKGYSEAEAINLHNQLSERLKT